MTGLPEANLLWRMENMDARTRRHADERAGLLAHMLRRGVGSGAGERRGAQRRRRTAPAVG
ncbi:hypothetical protein [Virgisporangium aurantiacum]|uniref:Uncharacterized protein n=1 Tax=Virgisporangium aurantiacum TaxID=175570 RepID=A0A8J4DYA7_9ACTN|nr:hypothetical protein [Virgisporangium aurantiacum]GIJ55465.1 hypothetical protein Vau01_029810 [Virgisporangium aurantiacum]